MYKNTKLTLIGILLLGSLAFFIGCSESSAKVLGENIPSDIEAVKLSEITSNPQEYNGKKVVVKGFVSGQCASLCEFFLKDGVQRATIFPQGYKLPKMTIGKKVTVYANVTAGEENVVFSALGLKME